MARLLLARHGTTKLNHVKRFWGKTDLELNADGIRQAERLRDRLAAEPIKAIYTSQMKRTRLTSEIIAARHKVAVTALADLAELNFGYAEGLTYEEICQQYPELGAELDRWDANPGFPGGESLAALHGRVLKVVPRLLKHKPGDTVLVVAHAGPLRVLICALLGIDLVCWRQLQVDLASLSVVETYPQGAILSRLNDVSHLTEEK